MYKTRTNTTEIESKTYKSLKAIGKCLIVPSVEFNL